MGLEVNQNHFLKNAVIFDDIVEVEATNILSVLPHMC